MARRALAVAVRREELSSASRGHRWHGVVMCSIPTGAGEHPLREGPRRRTRIPWMRSWPGFSRQSRCVLCLDVLEGWLGPRHASSASCACLPACLRGPGQGEGGPLSPPCCRCAARERRRFACVVGARPVGLCGGMGAIAARLARVIGALPCHQLDWAAVASGSMDNSLGAGYIEQAALVPWREPRAADRTSS